CRAREAPAGELHAVPGVAGEPDDDPIELLDGLGHVPCRGIAYVGEVPCRVSTLGGVFSSGGAPSVVSTARSRICGQAPPLKTERTTSPNRPRKPSMPSTGATGGEVEEGIRHARRPRVDGGARGGRP